MHRQSISGSLSCPLAASGQPTAKGFGNDVQAALASETAAGYESVSVASSLLFPVLSIFSGTRKLAFSDVDG
jgi:hypothetical protein